MLDLIAYGTMAMVASIASALGAGMIWAAARRRLARQAYELRIRDWRLSNLRAEIEERESLLDAFLTHSSDLVITLDTDGFAVAVSPSCERLLGYATTDMEGHACFDVIHPDDVGRARDWLASGTASDGRLRVRRRDGALLIMEARCRPLPDRRGALLVLSDVTRRVELEARLEPEDTLIKATARAARDRASAAAEPGLLMADG